MEILKVAEGRYDGQRWRWGAYIEAEEASRVNPDDIQNVTCNELQDSYQVELALMEDIES